MNHLPLPGCANEERANDEHDDHAEENENQNENDAEENVIDAEENEIDLAEEEYASDGVNVSDSRRRRRVGLSLRLCHEQQIHLPYNYYYY